MKRILFVTLVCALLLTACAGEAQPPQPSDPDSVIQAQEGKEFTIALEANPTTGYHWQIVGELDGAVVEFVSQDYQSTSEPGLVGGGGVEVWTFRAVGAGEATITLGYYPPSNDPLDPAQTQTFTVKVK